MNLNEYFRNTKGRGVLSTADGEGRVDAAVYSRPKVFDEQTVAFIMRDRLTHANLQSNPHAAYLFMEEGSGGYKGVRLFLTKLEEEQDTDRLYALRRRDHNENEETREQRGPLFLVTFRVDKVLPLTGTRDGKSAVDPPADRGDTAMRDKNFRRPVGKSTKAIHSGLENSIHGEVSVPIFESSTFSFPNVEEGAGRFSGARSGYIYTRLGNPTVEALEQTVAALENGVAGVATSSGMAAITSVFLSLLSRDEHAVSSEVIYGASRFVLEKDLSRYGVLSSFVDTSNLRNTEEAMRENTKMVFIETPSNPTMSITDIGETAKIAHRRGALLVVDNTLASPYLQRPIEHGADVVVHSLTKYLNGHSDVIGGIIVTSNKETYKKIKKTVNLFGGVMDPFQAWLILRGVRSLGLRVEKAQETTMRLAEFLAKHPNVVWVKYPGRKDHPHHGTARKQMDGFGAMISFGVAGGFQGGVSLMNRLRLITRAVSLGGVESLIEHPASMTHVSYSREERERVGITDELIRFSVGCEDFEDLKDDLEQALSGRTLEV